MKKAIILAAGVIVILLGGCSRTVSAPGPAIATAPVSSPLGTSSQADIPGISSGGNCHHTGPGWVTFYKDAAHTIPANVMQVKDAQLCSTTDSPHDATYILVSPQSGGRPATLLAPTGLSFSKVKPK